MFDLIAARYQKPLALPRAAKNAPQPAAKKIKHNKKRQ
jgi:predicted small lipoprotein YifL